MEIKILKDEKENLLVEIDNPTVAELLRVFLNKDEDVVMAAWKREHPDRNAIFELKTKGKSARKAFTEAISSIEKQLDKYLEEFKKAAK